jgi:hypothetical protein
MRSPHIDDFVRLMTDIPELALNRGEIGVVRSTWFAPSVAYEVEFHQVGHDYQTRALLQPEQVEVDEGPLFNIKALGPTIQVDDAVTTLSVTESR